jgi:hypothetical protein
MRAGANSTRNSRRIRAEPYSEHGRRKPRLSRCIECEKLPVKKGRLTRIRGERILHHRPMVPQEHPITPAKRRRQVGNFRLVYFVEDW